MVGFNNDSREPSMAKDISINPLSGMSAVRVVIQRLTSRFRGVIQVPEPRFRQSFGVACAGELDAFWY